MSRLHTRTLAIAELTPAQIEALYALYATYYGGTSPQRFRQDLQEKDLILLMEDAANQLQGFSTLKIIHTTHQGRPLRALFSGDTIISHAFWGEQTLPLAWCRLAGQIQAQQPDVPLYWLLIVKGDRTYRYLNVFSKQYYPNRRQPTPSEIQSLMDALAGARFGAHYRPTSGLVHYPQSQGHLKAEWHSAPDARNPEAQFFHQCNPGCQNGDELVCLTLLAPANLRSFALRGFQEGLAAGSLPIPPQAT